MWDSPPSAENLVVGKGSVYINRFDANGVGTGLRHIGNVDAMEITIEDDKLQKYSSMDAAASLYKEITRRRDARLRLTLSEFHPQNMALVTMGELDESYTQAATAVVDETLSTALVKGAVYQFAKFGPHTAITVEDEGGALTLNTDYRILDANLGLIEILESGGASEGDTLTASYTPTAYAAGTIPKVRGGTQNTVRGSLLFVGDPSTGPRMQVEVWKVSFTPDGAIGFISEEFAEMGLQGAIESDLVGHPTSPLYNITYLPY